MDFVGFHWLSLFYKKKIIIIHLQNDLPLVLIGKIIISLAWYKIGGGGWIDQIVTFDVYICTV